MTADQIANLEAGPEMDRLVAEACGLKEHIVQGRHVCWLADGRPWGPDDFEPSIDISAAMFAVERFCDPRELSADIEYRGWWAVDIWGGDGAVGKYVNTGSHADKTADLPTHICRSILILANRA